jgi:hypothetical protein
MTHPGTSYPQQGDNGSGNEDQLSHDHLQFTALRAAAPSPLARRSAKLRGFNLNNN